ncbi:MAG: hypothetical protein ACSHWU_10765 [Marinicella sp.]
MKMNVIFDATGTIVGAVHSMSEKGAECESGIEVLPGQNLHEVEVSSELAELEGNELLHKLSESDDIKKVLSQMTTAGHDF